MKLNLITAALLVLTGAASFSRAAAPDFIKEIKPILEQNCTKCHGEEQKKGGFRLHTKADALKGGDSGESSLVAGNAAKSPLYALTILPASDDKAMPPQPKNPALSQAQKDLLKAWIDAGAAWPDDAKLSVAKRIEFVADIQPILEFNCVACH